MRSPIRTTISSLTLALFVATAAAQEAPLGADERNEVLGRIGRALDERYVFPELGAACRRYLEQAVAGGDFDGYDEPSAFARRLTEELQRITKDKHLRVRHRAAAPEQEQREDPITAQARRLRFHRECNFGFARVERLEGNVGYLDLRGFAELGAGRRTAAAAMQLLHGADAVVVDLRRNGGGDPAMVQFLCSYFFGERTHLNSLYFRHDDRTTEFWTLDQLPGARMPDVPLYVLTSDYTFSAAEEFSYNLKTRSRATIVGETTGGGANPGGTVSVGRRFRVFVPTGRAINPVTGTNWEGVGVEPDVRCDAADALDKTLALAIPAAEAFRKESANRQAALLAQLRDSIASAEEHAAGERWQDAGAAMSRALEMATAAELWNETIVNELGYHYLRREFVPLAITVFHFNVARHPESANCYDSLGEAHLAAGDRARAIANYERSLELEPQNANGRRMLEKIRNEQGGGEER